MARPATGCWNDGTGDIDPTFNNDNGAHCISYYSAAECGDAAYDGKVNVSDAVYIINYVFSGGSAPEPLSIGDVNCDGNSNVSDAVYIINFVFNAGSPPCDTDRDGMPDC